MTISSNFQQSIINESEQQTSESLTFNKNVQTKNSIPANAVIADSKNVSDDIVHSITRSN